MLLHTPTLIDELKGSTLLLDNAVYVKASKNKEFFEFIKKLSGKSEIALLTVPPVSVEWTAQARGLTEYNKLVDWFNGLGAAVYRKSDEIVEHDPEFNVLIQKAIPKASYTDKLLCMMLNKYKHTNIMLVTSNHHDMPGFFDCKHIVSMDIGRSFHNMGFYVVSEENYKLQVANLSGAE